MLQSIRDKATGPLAWGIVAIISVPFAFFGIEAFRSGGGADFAAKVNGEEVSRYELEQRVDARYAQFQQMLGDNFNPEMFSRSQLRGGVLEDLIRETVVRQYLEQEGRRVSNSRVLEFVASQAGFQDERGNFSPEIYRETLNRQGSSTASYEQRVRDYLSSSQFESGVRDGGFVTEPELAAEWAWQEQERNLRWRRYALSDFQSNTTVSEEDVAKLYAERQSELLTPERVQVEYIELSLPKLAEAVEIDDAQIRAVYDGDRERYRSPETRTARHILVEEKALADELRAKILAGGDFAELAKEHSEDPGSKNLGGDLGIVARGVMVPPFEEAVFSLGANQLSEPVETQFGWHLIEVTQIDGGEIKALDEVQEQIANNLKTQRARQQLLDLQDQLEQAVFENQGSLAPAARDLNLETETSAWFTRAGGAGITADSKVVAAAYSDAVLNGGENSSLLSVGDSVIVLRLAAHEEPRQKTLEEVADELRQELIRKNAQQAMTAAMESDEALLGDSTEWDALEVPAGVTVEEARLKRTDSSVDRGILQSGFALSQPDDFGRANLAAGDVALVQVTEIQDAVWSEADESVREPLRQRIKGRLAAAEMQALIEALRSQAEVIYAKTAAQEG